LSGAQIIHFPLDKRMPTRIAEERLGSVMMYRYPDPMRINVDPQEWLRKWLAKKYVLLGWEAVKEGIVKSFKDGRVRHIVSRVSRVNTDADERPKVELACSLDLYPVFNWECEDPVKSVPVVVLSIDQTSYFRVCQRCLLRESKCLKG